MKEKSAVGVNERYTQWKTLVPVLYDWLANHNLVWPSLSCRWGPQLEQATYKNRQRLYLSEQTDGSVPNTLVIANCEVVKPRVAAAEHISQFNEEARSPFVKKFKTIIHPGEVNTIRELPQNSNIVATHTDSPDVLIWDVDAQPNRHAVLGATESRPDLILTGHKDYAEFALAMCPTEPFVLSGGKDKSVVLWSIQDHVSTLAAEPGLSKSPGSGNFNSKPASKSGGGNDKSTKSPSIGPRGVYQGHTDTVEDVQFCPSSAQEFCSVGDDSCLVLWDARTGSTPVVKVSLLLCMSIACLCLFPHSGFILFHLHPPHLLDFPSSGLGKQEKFGGVCSLYDCCKSDQQRTSSEFFCLTGKVTVRKHHAVHCQRMNQSVIHYHSGNHYNSEW